MSFTTDHTKISKTFSNYIEKIGYPPRKPKLFSKKIINNNTQKSGLIKKTEETCKKLREHNNDSTIYNNSSSYVSNSSNYIEEIFPKALNEIELSIDKLKKCYFSFYKKKQQKANSLISDHFIENHQKLKKMDIDTLKLKYFNYFHKESNDITELYNFYKEFTNEYKSKTFRKPHNQNSDTTSSKNSSSAMKKQKEFNEIDKKSSLVSNEFEKNLAQHLKKICRTNTHELLQKNKLSISILNKDLFNQKLNFINIMPTTNHGKPPKCDNYFKNKIRNSKSMEKMLNKKEIISNVSLNSNCSLEKRKDTAHHEKHQTEIDKIICLNNKSNNIFSTLPIEKQQKILMNNSKITDIDKIRNITKIFKNYRCTKSEIPNGKIKMQEKIDLSKVNENKFINFIDSFFEKSGIESKSIKGEKFLGKTEEIDEKSFMEGLKQAANNNNFNGKDISNDPSFILHS